MKSRGVLLMLCGVCAALQLVKAKCSLSFAETDKPFPDFEKLGVGMTSYQMSVEYTIPNAKQSDFYVEYYDIANRMGRVDVHQNNATSMYYYRAGTTEAWEVDGSSCNLKNISNIHVRMLNGQNDWIHTPGGKYDNATIGPSAMFKVAFDFWNSNKRTKSNMAYMGKFEGLVRGLQAQYWRRCDGENIAVDFYFTTEDDENWYGNEVPIIPLRVTFNDTGSAEGFSEEDFDIAFFKPSIAPELRPFDLPVGKRCRRLELPENPKVPNFMTKNLYFNAEVVYHKIDRSGGDYQFWSYVSTLRMARDLKSRHLFYYSTPWNYTKAGTDKSDTPDVSSPERVVFDMKNKYVYKTNIQNGQCSIGRGVQYEPKYRLPENAGSIPLMGFYILFPNDMNDFQFITEGMNRGLRVNVFETNVEGFMIEVNGTMTQVPNVTISHSYLQDDELTTGYTRNALVQVAIRMYGRQKQLTELLTFNFFVFSADIRNPRRIFNIKNCFRNDDDYIWATIGFNADEAKMEKVKDDIPSIELEVLGFLEQYSELSAVRVPEIEVDFKDALYVSLLILDRPPILLEFEEPEDKKTIIDTDDVIGIDSVDACGLQCAEKEDDCWGFAMCGAVCKIGVGKISKTASESGCKFYRIYDRTKHVYSKEMLVENLRSYVNNNQVHLMLKDKDNQDKMIQFDATSFEVSIPAENDLFNHVGSVLNPRMRVLKPGYKLALTTGETVKNLGSLRYEDCQRECLDFSACETMSYCLTENECVLSPMYGSDLTNDTMEKNNMCNLVTRKYTDHFERVPGISLSLTAKKSLNVDVIDDCARACMKETDFQCLSFDFCQAEKAEDKDTCNLHTVHFTNSKTRESVVKNNAICGHYFRKYSTEFLPYKNTRTIGSSIPPRFRVNLEECAKFCVEYGQGICHGFDFCQGSSMLDTSCTLMDKELAAMQMHSFPTCTNFVRNVAFYAPRPYSTSYASGIGFLCFVFGVVIGLMIVFGIAYLRVNRQTG